MTPGEITSNVIAALALLISVYGFIRDKKQYHRDHEFNLVEDIYRDHLVLKLPASRAKVNITASGIVSGIDDLIDELHAIRKDSIYFKYANPTFFEELVTVLWDLEDYLVLIEEPFIGEARVNFDYEVSYRLEKIYKCLLNKF